MWKMAVAAGVWPDVTSESYRQPAQDAFMEAQLAIEPGGSVPTAIAKVEAECRKALGDAAPSA
jgi:hypothetical protein